MPWIEDFFGTLPVSTPFYDKIQPYSILCLSVPDFHVLLGLTLSPSSDQGPGEEQVPNFDAWMHDPGAWGGRAPREDAVTIQPSTESESC
jgi:hypothetical protein